MKNSPILFFSLFFSFTILSAAPTQYVTPDNWYVASSLGLSMPTDDSITTNIGSASQDNDLGFNFVASGGHDWDGKRMELEYSHRRAASTMQSTVPSLDQESADMYFNSLMLNFIYDFPLNEEIYWFNGLGIGMVWINFETLNNNDTDSQFGWQVFTGLGYRISHQVSLTATYRLYTSKNASFTNGSTTFNVDTPYLSVFELGVRYDF
jgi:opacity protein-like surface antigen